jgi:predicted nucleic acid-binding protein
LNFEDRQEYLARVCRPLLKIHSSLALYEEALRLHAVNKLQWYDSLIVGAARESGCAILYSEDLQHGQKFGSLKIVNHFL